ncbi:MAG: DsbA family protein [Alphaproteobacteria bacterium]
MKAFKRWLFLPLLVLLAGPVVAPQAADETFTPTQKAAIEKMIRAYLMAHPDILIEMTEELERKQKAQAASDAAAGIVKYRDEVLSNGYDHVVNPDGAVPVVEFFDYNCGYCKRILPTMQQLQAKNDDLRFIFKELPILSDESIQASRVAIAAKKQGKYLELHNELMAYRGRVDGRVAMKVAEDMGLDMNKLKQDLHSPEVGAEIDANRRLAEALGIRGTPTLLIGESLIPGALPYERIMAVVEERRQNCAIC